MPESYADKIKVKTQNTKCVILCSQICYYIKAGGLCIPSDEDDSERGRKNNLKSKSNENTMNVNKKIILLK